MPASPIDPESGTPLYGQLAEDLRRRLREGEWLPGAALPSEADLVYEYDLSRNTVRRVLYRLRDEGFIVSRRGERWQAADPLPGNGEPEVVLLPPGADLWFEPATEDERRRYGLPRGASMAFVHFRAVTRSWPVARVRFKVAWNDTSGESDHRQ